jgi:hypothetical protein
VTDDVADLEMLRVLDDTEDTECPPGFDWHAADASFRAMATALATALGESALHVEGAESIQDASFHGEIRLPESLLNPGAASVALIATSNFGRLAAVRPEAAVRLAVLRTIRQLLTEHGYVYVPAALQDAPYDGRALLDSDTPTWWTRYFDYQ